jgi:DNA polymerase-1
MLWRLIHEEKITPTITHMAVVFDTKAPTFRHHLHTDYKAHRPKPPEDLIPQFSLIHQSVDAFSLIGLAQDGYEADDLIATYAKNAEAAGMYVTIVGSDKDLMQLVAPHIRLFDPIKRRSIGESEVFEKFGVSPNQVPDVQALVGDSSDNIPGLPGIGIKTAAKLISEYKTLENLLEQYETLSSPRQKQSLHDNEELAHLGKKLATLDTHVPFHIPLDDLRIIPADAQKLLAFLKAFDLRVIARRVAQFYDADINSIPPNPELSAPGAGTEWVAPNTSPIAQSTWEALPLTSQEPKDGWSPQEWSQIWCKNYTSMPITRENYTIISSLDVLKEWCTKIRERGIFSVDTETTSLKPHHAELVGLSFSIEPGSGAYIPLQHRLSSHSQDYAPNQLPIETVLTHLGPLLTDSSLLKVGHNIKYDALILRRYGIILAGYDDTMLMSYALDAGLMRHGLDTLADHFLNHRMITYDDLTKRNRKKISFEEVPIPEAAIYSAEDAEITLRLWHIFSARLTEKGLWTIYLSLDRPVIEPVIAMEERGIRVDKEALQILSHDFGERLKQLEKEIYSLAGKPFSIGSPQQIGELLFEQMGLKTSKKTSTGQWSTSSNVLEELSAQGHMLPEKILQWRHLSKLRATYTESLLEHMDPVSNRVHTSYGLAGTITGRFSSSDPNLQNIPVRTEPGRAIRAAFTAEKGFKLLSADYAQIELRLLAHSSEIPELIAAFEKGEDIHTHTASEVFGVPIAAVTADMRRHAKTINFGILYGMSAFSLAGQLGVSRTEARLYLNRYFSRFPGIKDYIERSKDFCRTHGYVTTLFGRLCHYPHILSSKPSERAFAERQAVNAALQGSAADIIRRAMTHVAPTFLREKLHARLLLQVHDELVFEVPDSEIEKTCAMVTRIMENAPLPTLSLRVPLKVSCTVSQHWGEPN